MQATRVPRIGPERADEIRNRLRRGRHGGQPLAFNKTVYRRRNVTERCFNRFKQGRGIATHYDRTAQSFETAISLAATCRR